MYLWLKLIHILAVVLFLGNIITGVFWHRHAASTRDPKILAHTAAGLTQSDRIFTIPAVLLIVLAGIAAAIEGNFPILHTGWILWTLILFSISGFAFMAQVAPLQRKLHALAAAGAAGGTFDYAAYHKVAGRWEFWGAIATLAPIVGLALMVLKPVL
ncbi:MAG TPA: DUF2269 family protein [Candidatus Limnocylindrales bacterium]|nr:DUF2269 family protein [Candidatus Limnocylindrales bacterium]